MAGVGSKPTEASAGTGAATPPESPRKVIGGHVDAAPAQSMQRCARHREVDALVRCDRCKTHWCANCVRRLNDHGNTYWLCNCGGRGESLPDPSVGERRRYERHLGNAIRAPLSGTGLQLMLAGSVCYGTLDALLGTATRATLFAAFQNLTRSAGAAPVPLMHDLLLSATGIVLFLLVLGYQFAWVQQVICDSALGRPALERFPTFTSVQESVAIPAVESFATLAACVGPGLLAMTIGPLPLLFGMVLSALGFVAFPMALASVAVDGSLRGLDPVRIGRGMRACGIEYALVVALFCAALGAMLGGGLLFGAVPWIGPVVKAFFILATTAMAAQVLGLVVARQDAQLHWLADSRGPRE